MRKLKRKLSDLFFAFLILYSVLTTLYIMEMRDTYQDFRKALIENGKIIQSLKDNKSVSELIDERKK